VKTQGMVMGRIIRNIDEPERAAHLNYHPGDKPILKVATN